jgi:hypothetical protein
MRGQEYCPSLLKRLGFLSPVDDRGDYEIFLSYEQSFTWGYKGKLLDLNVRAVFYHDANIVRRYGSVFPEPTYDGYL